MMRNGLIVDSDGMQRWYLDDKLHRDENGLPAVIYPNGSQAWYSHGQCNRENDLPAVIWENGLQWWYHHDHLHRENGPAIIEANGSQRWYLDDNIIDVEKWIKDNNLPSWESWDTVTWSLFRLEFL